MELSKKDLIDDFILDSEIVEFDDDGNEIAHAVVILKEDYLKLTKLVDDCALAEVTERDNTNCNISNINKQGELLLSFCNYYAEVCKIEFNAKDFLIKSFLERK